MKKFLSFFSRRQLLRASVVCFLVGLSLILGAARAGLTVRYDQQAATRWKADETRFAQVSAYFSIQNALSYAQIRSTRYDMDSTLTGASIIAANADARLWLDAFSVQYDGIALSNTATSSVSVLAVGGDYFFFHPDTLLSGAYFSESDDRQDKAVLDESAAWQLFGSYDVVGQNIVVDNITYTVCGVIRRADDAATTLTYGSQPHIWLSYQSIFGAQDEAITCYEAVLPDPYTGYALSLLRDSYNTKDLICETVENSSRYHFPSLWKTFCQQFRTPMRNTDVAFPYWENAALYTQSKAALLLILQLACLPYPFVVILVGAIWLFKHRRWHLRDIKTWYDNRIDQRNQAIWAQSQHIDPFADDVKNIGEEDGETGSRTAEANHSDGTDTAIDNSGHFKETSSSGSTDTTDAADTTSGHAEDVEHLESTESPVARDDVSREDNATGSKKGSLRQKLQTILTKMPKTNREAPPVPEDTDGETGPTTNQSEEEL